MSEKYDRRYLIETAVGLQDVDGLRTSEYFNEVSNKYIKGEISLDKLEVLINSYYKKRDEHEDRSEEADKVSIRFAKYLEKDEFKFSIEGLKSIHKYLFDGLIDHAGELRTYNISKKEWVLDGASVIYGDYRELYEILNYDLNEEKQFDYSGLNVDQFIDHISKFIANLWQCHAFSEGNTRTIAMFTIKYLRALGYDATNDLFKNNSWYFRNALARANYSDSSRHIYEDNYYLIKFFRNLLLGEDHPLRSRDILIKSYVIEERTIKFSPTQTMILDLIKHNKNIKTEELALYLGVSLKTVKNNIAYLKERNEIARVGGKRYGYWVAIPKDTYTTIPIKTLCSKDRGKKQW